MELVDAIKSRISIRSFKPVPVPDGIISNVLDIARFSPSGTNTQPWEFIVVTGKSLEKLRAVGINNITKGIASDHPMSPYTGIYRERQVVLGKEIFRIMGIAREDKKGREEWVLEGVRFFGAPAVIIIAVDNEYYINREEIGAVNIGIVVYAITLAALEFGLGTCIQHQGIQFARDVKKALNIPESKHLVTCLSIGYPEWTAPINKLRAEREMLDKMTTWMR